MAPRLRPKVRRFLIAGVAISIATVVAMAVYYQVQEDVDIVEDLRDLDLRFLLAALALHIAAHVFWAGRQAALARGIGWPLRRVRSMSIITAGVFAAAVTPARVGGDGLRLALLQAEPESDGWQPAQVVLADRALDLLYFISLGLFGAFSVPFLFGPDAVWVQSLAFLGVGLFIVVLILINALVASRALVRVLLRPIGHLVVRVAPGRGPRLRRRVDGYLDEMREGLLALLREEPGRLALAGLFTAATWLAEFSILYVLLQGFGHDVAFLPVFIGAVLLNIVMTLPLTPGGSGIAEVAALVLFSALAPGVSPAFVLVWRTVTYYYDVVVGGIVTLRSAAGWITGDDEPDALDTLT